MSCTNNTSQSNPEAYYNLHTSGDQLHSHHFPAGPREPSASSTGVSRYAEANNNPMFFHGELGDLDLAHSTASDSRCEAPSPTAATTTTTTSNDTLHNICGTPSATAATPSASSTSSHYTLHNICGTPSATAATPSASSTSSHYTLYNICGTPSATAATPSASSTSSHYTLYNINAATLTNCKTTVANASSTSSSSSSSSSASNNALHNICSGASSTAATATPSPSSSTRASLTDACPSSTNARSSPTSSSSPGSKTNAKAMPPRAQTPPLPWASKTCSLIFTWPTKDKLQTSDYWVSGSGALSFAKADGEGAGVELGRVQPAVEGRYVIWSGMCEAGKEVRFRGSSVGGVDLRWFQDYNPEPIGLWVVAC
ncbi:hypothetical protein KVT40_000586 [Elsinoe batatas]|uniref:Ubiquitin 3 binding protein But2 C-terminal domain-containing protein n=1 Tax=Elsinoe batatas TaxID=2601811 RepID=A0A8K0LBL5_9PEZI|nr:hypothetical protein KVT40_000586 [Elsinoe batatas]